jgi:hypothetical protein
MKRLVIGWIAIGVVLVGCRGAEDAPSADAAPSSEAIAADHAAASQPEGSEPAALRSRDVPLSGTETEQDWEILAETIDWAREQGLDTVPIGDAISRIGLNFVGSPYVPGTLEVADPEALVVNLREFDCVTFVESAFALAKLVQTLPRDVEADDPTVHERYAHLLADLRYRDGRIDGYPSRLHYFSEWIQDNARRGNVESISHLIGGVRDDEVIDFMTTHPTSYRQLADPDVLDRIREMERSVNRLLRYPVPEGRIADFASEIRDGDIIAATSTVEGLDVAHTGLAVWIDGELHLMHAPLVGDSVQVSTRTLAARIDDLRGQDGILVARPLEVRR